MSVPFSINEHLIANWPLSCCSVSTGVRDAVDNFTLANILRQWIVVSSVTGLAEVFSLVWHTFGSNKTKHPHID